MYHADPADEGEPSSGFFYAFSIPAILTSILLLSCQEKNKKELVIRPVVVKDTAKPKETKPPPVAAKPKKKKKKIYLTFDDGPNKGTKNVLDIVQQEEVPVTFFIVGEHVFASPGQNQVWDSLKMAENIELCNHSYTHAHNRYDKFYQQPDSVVKDIKKTQQELLPETNIVRTPGRNTWRIDSLHFTDIKKSKAAVDSLQKAGFIVFGWDLEWHYDHKTLQVKSTADEMLAQVDSLFSKGKTKVKDNLVILAHDQVYHKSNDSMQLRDFIQKLKKKDNYELALVSSYPGIAKDMIDSVRAAPQ
ncbi:MAG: polysaccharide deacetylase family protein [Chitinophagaceae bacterium]|nr:polysaccharide deacetylase family protein [Chitinophagaceae bacterium]